MNPTTEPIATAVQPGSEAKAETGSARNVPLKTILVPTDFSDAANNALRFAIRFAQQHGGEITLLHVVEVVIAPEFAAYAAFADEEDLKRRMRDRLCDSATSHDAERFLKRALVRRGTPYHEICKMADEVHADLIVIGTHGYTGMKHVMLGSTAERVVRHAPCPVLVVPGRKPGSPVSTPAGTT